MIAHFRTVTGEDVDLVDLDPEAIRIEDVAHHLAWTCRYNAAIKRWYSNAQHSHLVSELCELALTEYPGLYRELVGTPDLGPRHAADTLLACHLHDASETYTGDATSPMKEAVRFFARFWGIRSPLDALEESIQLVMEAAFDLPLGSLSGGRTSNVGVTTSPKGDQIHLLVKHCDALALQIEDSVLRPELGIAPVKDAHPDKVVAHPQNGTWDREEAKRLFLERYRVLQKRRSDALTPGRDER